MVRSVAFGEGGVAEERADGPVTSSVRSDRHSRLDGLQILRGAAAFLVVFHHFCLLINQYTGRSRIAAFRSLAEAGSCGVDIFFVISGFIITYVTLRKPDGIGAWDFALARVRRIVPLYWFYTFVVIAMWASHKALKSLVMTKSLIMGSLFFLPVVKMQIATPDSTHPLVDQGWTLQYEAFFYLMCFVVIALAGSRRIFPLAPLLVLEVFAMGLVVPGMPAYLGDPLLLEFVGGTVLGWAAATGRLDRLRGGPAGRWALAGGVLALVATIFLPEPTPWRALVWGVPGFFLVLGAALVQPDSSKLPVRVGIYLGEASYSIYLAHGFSIMLVGTLMKAGHLLNAGDGFLLAASVVTVAITSLGYVAIEKPMDRFLRKVSGG